MAWDTHRDDGDVYYATDHNDTIDQIKLKATSASPDFSLFIDIDQAALPASPSADKLRLMVQDIHGYSQLTTKDEYGMIRRIGRDSVFIALNGSGATVAAFKAVYVVAGAGDVPSIGLAKANDLNTMPAVGVSLQSIENGAYGRIMQVGLIENINWSITPEGTPIYVSPTTAGDYTVTPPVYPNFAQEIGNVFITGAAGQMQVRMGALQTIPLDYRYVRIDTIDNPNPPAIDTLYEYTYSTGFTGRVSGGTISNCTATPDSWITVSAGAGFIRGDASETSQIRSFEWAALDLQLSSSENGVNYIYVDYNTGTPIIKQTTDRTSINFTSQFTLGRAYYYSTHTPKQRIINSGTNVWNLASRIHERELSTEGFAWASGAVTTQPANLKLQTTDGNYYLGINKVTTTAKNTNAATPDTFIVWYRSATPGLWKEVAPATTLIADQWDNNSGTISTTVTTNRYTIQWIYILYDGSLNVVLGHKYGDTTTCTYTLSEAEAAQAPETPPLISKFGVLVAKAIIAKGGTSIYELQETRLSYSTGSAADHANLSSLDYTSAGHTGFAPIASPSFTGTPVLPTGTTGTTQAVGTNSTTIATTAFVLANISSAWSSFSPTPIWGTANPTITTTVARFATTGKTTTFNVSFVISNGNDASSLTMSLPVAAPQIATYYYALKAFKEITTGGDSIRSDPFAYIDYTLATPIIKFYQFGTLPAGYTAILNISGSYEVA